MSEGKTHTLQVNMDTMIHIVPKEEPLDTTEAKHICHFCAYCTKDFERYQSHMLLHGEVIGEQSDDYISGSFPDTPVLLPDQLADSSKDPEESAVESEQIPSENNTEAKHICHFCGYCTGDFECYQDHMVLHGEVIKEEPSDDTENVGESEKGPASSDEHIPSDDDADKSEAIRIDASQVVEEILSLGQEEESLKNSKNNDNETETADSQLASLPSQPGDNDENEETKKKKVPTATLR